LEYYNQAAALGDVGGLCGAAGMYIKGEGTDKNVSQAVVMYESAAAQGSVRALNGLGFFYFFGDGDVPANHTKALHYFLAATEQQDGDSDSWFNAGYCIEHGLGTEADPQRAATFYAHAAKTFGHFGSIVAMGNMHYEGRGVTRSVKESVYYLGVANDVGPWMGWLRRGFDQFVQGGKQGLLTFDADSKPLMRSALCYIHAGELGGFEVSQSNAAYLLQRKFNLKTKQLYLGSNLLEAIVPSKQLLLDSPRLDHSRSSDLTAPAGHAIPSADFADRLLLREFALSTAQGNANSACSIGTLLLAGHDGEVDHTKLPGDSVSGGVPELGPEDAFDMVLDTLDKEFSFEKFLPSSYLSQESEQIPLAVEVEGGEGEVSADYSRGVENSAAAASAVNTNTNANAKAAMAWFSKASAMNSALGSFHSGLMYHFGIGGVEPNFPRASRYYSVAISNTANPLHPSLKLMAQMAQWMIEGGHIDGEAGASLSWLSRSANGIAGWVAKKMLL
jgi:TPR repeat protein